MLLRVRVRLPDRPGSLGKVARTLGAAGADVVQMAVLERDSGRALDDFTVAWPAGIGIERLCDGLSMIPGVEIIGVWQTVEPQGAFPDAALIGQLAADTTGGLLILTDATPAILSADWAALVQVGAPGAGMPGGGTDGTGGTGGPAAGPVAGSAAGPEEGAASADQAGAIVLHTSIGGGTSIVGAPLPELRPLRPRAFTGADGTRYAVTPIAGGELALLLARIGAPPFHRTEVFRLAQLVGAAEAVLGSRLDAAAAADVTA